MTNEFLKDHPELEKLFEKLTGEPDSHVFAPLADSCRKIGRLDEALEICRNGVERHPEYASGHVVLGKCHFDIGDMENAKTAFQRVLSLDENNLVALKYLGMILAEQGNQPAAREHFKHILALDPDNIEIRSKLESMQASEESFAAAAEQAGEERETAAAEQASEESIAAAVEQAGKESETAAAEPVNEEDEEILLLDEILDEDFEGSTILLGNEEETSDELATLTLADIYASQGYLHKAKGIYEEVLRKWPDHSQAKAKLTALELEGTEPVAPVEDGAEEEDNVIVEDLHQDEGDDPAFEPPQMSEETPVGETALPSAPVERDIPDAVEKSRPARKEPESTQEDDGTAPEGIPIDSSTDIEKFKRWLESMSE